MSPPALSVVIPTTHGWPDVALPLESLLSEAREHGVEVIVADGSGRADPGCADVSWLRLPGETVFALRAAGIERAAGDVVAVTEDHVRVATDYCRAVLAAHRDSPALMIGGAVANGSHDPIGWASYFMSNIESLPPERGPWRAPLTGQANITYKRELLRQLPAARLLDAALRADLAARGLAHNDARLRVLHIQSLGLRGSCLHHFHDGRYVAARRRVAYRGPRWAVELAKTGSLPYRAPIVAARVIARTALRHPPLHADLARSAAMVALLSLSHCVGELVGFVAGEGDAARHIP